MRILFGKGEVAVSTGIIDGVKQMLIVMPGKGLGVVGGDIPELVGKEVLPEDTGAIQFYFSNPESVQVVIDHLQGIKASLEADNE